MGDFLSEIGKGLADRWLALLALPGALYLAAAIAARTLGQAHSFDVQRLITQVIAWAKSPAATTVGGQVVLVAAALAGSAAAGLAAQALSSLAERFILAAGWQAWTTPLRQFANSRVKRRLRRWDTAHAAYQQLYQLAVQGGDVDRDARYAAYRDWSRIAPERPERPTWSGDRINAVSVRLDRDLHLDLPTIWPSLWLTLPDTARTDITAARQAFAQATTLIAWAVLYAPLTDWWWPASLLAVVLAVTGWRRGHAAADTFATLLEATVRVYVGGLATQLGIDHDGQIDQEYGDRLTAILATSP